MLGDGRLSLMGSESFKANELYRVVTFLNQCLKQQGLVFGLTRTGEVYNLKVYEGRADIPVSAVTVPQNADSLAGGTKSD